ncbi:unnamed protein product [Calicophoron daubneyi]|uniref:Pikachurin n=1 Tax=Calicophoron daubneyi TaxID=300641 RepID=A0AAV2TRG6_CALDB
MRYAQASVVSFEFRPTCVARGCLIVYHSSSISSKRFSLTIEDRQLVYRFVRTGIKNPWNSETFQEIHHPLLMGPKHEWISVEFGDGDNGREFFTVNGDKKEVLPSPSVFGYKTPAGPTLSEPVPDPESQPMEYIYFGGHPNLKHFKEFDNLLGQFVYGNFAGCIQNIYINHRHYDPRRKPFVGDAVEGYGLSDCAENVCYGVHCENNGTCAAQSGTTYECQCPLGTKGPHCTSKQEINLPLFTGRSFIEYRGLQDTSRSFTTLTLVFEPTHADGLILYEGYSYDRRGDFLAILLIGGHVVLLYDLGSGTAYLRHGKKLLLNAWHTINLWILGRKGFLTLNDEVEPHIVFSTGDLVQLTLAQRLYLGGHPDLDLTSAYLSDHVEGHISQGLTGFRGCIQELQINGQPVALIDDAIRGINVANCISHPCGNPLSICNGHGECVPQRAGFQCYCPLGRSGIQCQGKMPTDRARQASFEGSSYLEYMSEDIMTIRLVSSAGANNRTGTTGYGFNILEPEEYWHRINISIGPAIQTQKVVRKIHHTSSRPLHPLGSAEESWYPGEVFKCINSEKMRKAYVD